MDQNVQRWHAKKPGFTKPGFDFVLNYKLRSCIPSFFKNISYTLSHIEIPDAVPT